jgi:hypothetical protein
LRSAKDVHSWMQTGCGRVVGGTFLNAAPVYRQSKLSHSLARRREVADRAVEQPLIGSRARRTEQQVAMCSGYRAPCTVILEAALTISRRSSGVSSTTAAPMFSSRAMQLGGVDFACQETLPRGLNCVCATDCLCGCFRHAEVLDRALLNEVLYGSRDVFDRNPGVRTVLIVEIDGINPEPFERAFDRLLDMLRTAIQADITLTSIGFVLMAELGGDNYLPTKR